MDLREWEKMSPEEQQRYTEKEYPESYHGSEKPTQGNVTKNFISNLKAKTDRCTCCDDATIELKGWLATQLEDEIKASSQYKEAANSAKIIEFSDSGKKFAETLDNLSTDEYRHFLEIIGIVDILNGACYCGDK